MTQSDEELMLAHRAGDPGAFATIFRRWGPRVRDFFARRVRGREDLDDLVQLTFVRLHRARDAYDPKFPLRGLLFSIAIRVKIDEHRRKKNVSGTELSDATQDTAASPEERVASAQRLAQVQRAMDQLSDREQAIVLLHRFEELSFAEIAEVLSDAEGKVVTEGAARVRAFRAYDSLKQKLLALEGEGE